MSDKCYGRWQRTKWAVKASTVVVYGSAIALAMLMALPNLGRAEAQATKQLAIVHVFPNLVSNTLTIAGTEFGTRPGIVTLDQLPLTLVSWTDTQDRKSTRLNSSHSRASRMPSSA